MPNTDVKWQQAARTTYQISPGCSTRAVQKHFLEKSWKKGPLANFFTKQKEQEDGAETQEGR